jgi:hypothetical protein
MAASDLSVVTYDDGSRREDLLDVIGDVSPDDTPLATMLATSEAKNTLHEWQEEYLSPPNSVTAATEGAAASYNVISVPQRRNNVTAILNRTFRVTGTEKVVNTAGAGDPLDRAAAKSLRLWKMDQEWTLINGNVASGASGTARGMAGIANVITTLATVRASGTSLSETEFQDMVQDSWAQGGNEYVFDLVLVPYGLKRKIDGFTAGNTKWVDASDKKLTAPVEVYETSAGVHRLMAHRYVNNTNASVTFLGIKEDLYRIAYLRRPFREMLAKDGDRENGEIIGEFTLEYLAERTSVRRQGYNRNG